MFIVGLFYFLLLLTFFLITTTCLMVITTFGSDNFEDKLIAICLVKMTAADYWSRSTVQQSFIQTLFYQTVLTVLI